MTLPAGALTATVTVGGAYDTAGTAGTLVSLHVRLDVPDGLVWAATGDRIEPWQASGPAGTLDILADQPGVLTSGTVSGAPAMVEVRGWPLVATWVTRQGTGGEQTRRVRRFAAPAAGTTVDLDLLPQDGALPPATITYAQTWQIGSNEIAAAASAVAADGSASAAAGSAAAAAGSAFDADGSADAAALSATAASGSATTATTKAADAETARAAAEAAAGAATTKAGEASAAAGSAAAAAGVATTKAGEASASAATATTQAATATTKAAEALASANNAAATLAAAIPKTLVDAKGDLLVGTASDTLARLAVGPNGSLLMADSNSAGGLSYQSPIPLLVNLLTNSDFSNGTTGWSTVNSATLRVASGQLGVTAISQWGAASQSVATVVGNIYYSAVTLTGAAAGHYYQFGQTGGTLAATTQRLSRRNIARFTSEPFVIGDNRASGWTEVLADNAICIDLTACFGAGKEPSKDEMDAIMARYPNSWFAKETPQLLPSYDWLKLTQNAATNLVTNGDFSNGTTGWGGGGSSLSATSGVLAITGDGSDPVPTAQVIPSQTFIAGEKWYAAVSVRVTNSSVTTMRARFIAGCLDIDQASPVSGTWYTQSGTFTVTSTITAALAAFSATYPDAATASGKAQEVKNVLAINLTKTFGAGNEPTKSEMDYLLTKYPNSWFNGTVNDLVSRYNLRDRVGTGSPEGAIAAPVGTQWTDTLNTNGALVWRKATGTGNTGWVPVILDTGLRNVTTAWLINGWTATAVYARRVGQDVTLIVEGLNASAMTSPTWISIPAGWLPYSGAGGRGLLHRATTPAEVYRVFTDVIAGSSTATPVLYGSLRWITSGSTVPSTLPGTPV